VTDTHLTVLDVGHGNAAVLAGPLGTVLIDAGAGPWVLEYLESQQVDHVDAVAITHSDEDHLKGLVGLLDSDAVSLGLVRVNSDATKPSGLWDAVTFSLGQLSGRGELDFQISLAVGDELPYVADDVRAEVLGPSRYLAARGPGSTDREGRAVLVNSMSAVIRVLVGEEPYVLLAADIDQVGLQNLVGEKDMRAAILVFPHHGGNVRPGATPGDNVEFTRLLLEAVQPETVVFSLGRGSYQTPRPEIIEAIREHGSEMKIACTQLSEACAQELPPDGAFDHLTDLLSRGKPKRTCCAGTIRIPLPGDLVPRLAPYEAFKAQYAETALCRQH
jgi:beta-lactamase superfamily II metal-dependent hydrolase